MNSVEFLLGVLLLYTSRWVCGYNVCDQLDKDLVFIMDGSESISESDFQKANKAIMDMIKPISSIGSRNRIAYMLFGNDADIIFNLNNKLKKKNILELISSMKNKHAATGIGRALNQTLHKIVPLSRKHGEKIILLFTDGTNNLFPSPFSYAEDIKKAGFKIVTIGIGSGTSKAELKRIASSKSNYNLKNFNSIIPTLIQIMDHLCPIPQPMPWVPCELNKLDFVIVQDCSRSLSKNDYVMSKKFAFNVFSPGKIDGVHYRYAFMQFSDKPKLVFNLDKYTKRHDIERAIKRSHRFGDATGIGKALELVEKEVLPKRRRGVPFIVMLMTDGVNNIYPRPQGVAERLKKAGAYIVTIGVNKRVNVQELKEIASDEFYLTIRFKYGYKFSIELKKRDEMLKYMICKASLIEMPHFMSVN